MDAFLFFDVEAEVVDAFADKEVKNFVSVVEGFAAYDGDDVEVDAVLAKKTCTAHGLLVGAFALTGLPMRVVDGGGPVNTEPDGNVMRFNKFAPGFVNEHSVTLEGMENCQFRRCLGADEREGVFVPGNRDGEGFAGVPDEGDEIADEIGAENLRDNGSKSLRRHAMSFRAAREIAIIAIDIAERGRLDHGEPEPLFTLGARVATRACGIRPGG